MFITTPDSPVYCSQHPSQGTHRQSRTKKILGEHKKFTDPAHACLPLLSVLVLIVTEPHPSAVCSHVCTCGATDQIRGIDRSDLMRQIFKII